MNRQLAVLISASAHDLEFHSTQPKASHFQGHPSTQKKTLSKLDQSQPTAHLYSNFSLESTPTGRLTKFACMIRARDVLASSMSASFWQSRATNEGNRSIRVPGLMRRAKPHIHDCG